MEKKKTIISLIAIILIIGCAVAYIIISGMIAQKYNYVQIEVNPRIEFLCDKKFDVVSVYPLNIDAEIILSDINLIGLDIDEATVKFIDECAKCGFIDVDGLNNATNITVIDGITQALDVHVTKEVYKYFRDNEIMAVVTETYEDRSMFDSKKENKVACSNKLKLINTIIEQDENLNINSLRKNSEVELVEKVKARHKENPYSPTEELLLEKQKLIRDNEVKYKKHINNITDNTQKEFSELFDRYQRLSSMKYTNNFNNEYYNWQKTRL